MISEIQGPSPATLCHVLPFIIDRSQVVAIVGYQYKPGDDHSVHCHTDILSNSVLEQNSNL